MPTYQITIKEIELYMMEIEASTKEIAQNIADSRMENENKIQYHYDSDYEIDIKEEY